jgi:mono/diheme cytochrome c family protein
LAIIAVLLPVCTPAAPSRTAATADAFERRVKPLFQRSCGGCHSGSEPKGGITFDLRSPAIALAQRDVFEKAIAKLRSGEMPPPPLPRLKPAAIEAAARWFEGRWAAFDRKLPPDPGRVTARRLNRAEYDNTVRDLLGVDLKPATDFPADDSGYGFDNIGDVLSVSPVLLERYLAAAGRLARTVIVVPSTPAPTLVRLRRSSSPAPEFESRHSFPRTATYEIRAAISGAKPKGVDSVRMSIAVDGRAIEMFDVDIREDRERSRGVPVRLAAGDHFPRATLLDPHPGLSINQIDVRGPYDAEPEPLTPSHRRIVVCLHDPGQHEPACARKVAGTFLARAWRRPPASAEVDVYTALIEKGPTFEEGVRLAVQAALISPHFLFRIESPPPPGQRVRTLGDFEIASRLSYFLWSSMPDDELFRAARLGRLRQPSALLAQVRRMLADRKADALAEHFAGQWLQLRNLKEVKPDPVLFPQFDAELRAAMRIETERLFLDILRGGRSALELVGARYTFLNERLARHYGISGVRGPEFRRVSLEGTPRAGVLTHASLLTVTSYPNRTSPVIRGKFLLENFLNAPPPPPPANVPSLEESSVANAASLRQKLEQHRADPGCASCHARMDPLGFALENYDAIGRWRTRDGGIPIDPSASLPGGRTLSGPADLRDLIRSDPQPFARGLAEKLLTYALGRGLERPDRPFIDTITGYSAARQYSLQAMVEAIVVSAPFRQIRAEQEAGKETALR